MDIDLELLREVFDAEAEEHLRELEACLLRLESHPGDVRAVRDAFRAIHTLKGSASTVGFAATADLAHRVEDVLDRIRLGALDPTPDVVSLLLEAVDGLRRIAADPLDPPEETCACAEELAERLLRCVETAIEAAGDAEAGREATRSAREPDWISQGRARDGDTLRIGVRKLDRLLDLAGEIVIARASFQQLLGEVKGRMGERLREAFRESGRLTMELQEQVSNVLMVPVGPTLRSYVRVARDLAVSLGKQVQVEIAGEDVEVDAAVVAHLRDPLTHMVRNAIDHGLETPEERAACGKPAQGRLVLKASQRAGSIVIEAIDDGVGLDRERIFERAVSRGIVASDAVLSDSAVFDLIFEEGFSTAKSVTELSGRGVGMGVVRQNVESFGGSVKVSGALGRGATVSLQLPLTLAILEVLTVQVGDETLLVPVNAVVECFDLPASLRGQSTGWVERPSGRLPFARLGDLLGVRRSAQATTPQVVRVAHEGSGIGLVVDFIAGTQQVVIKPLSRIYRELPGIAGCTILHSGRVALIVDVKGVIDVADRLPAPTPGAPPSPARARTSPPAESRA